MVIFLWEGGSLWSGCFLYVINCVCDFGVIGVVMYLILVMWGGEIRVVFLRLI